jgi:glucose-1-phosphate cytidylyltransferase
MKVVILATLTAIGAVGGFGAVDIADKKVIAFKEKPRGDGAWINSSFSFIENDHTVCQQQALETLA